MVKKKSQGTTLHISNEDADTTAYASATWAKIGGITTIGEPDGEAQEIPTTDLDSTAAEFEMGLPDNGKYPISGFAIEGDPGQTQLRAARNAQQKRWIKQTDSTGDIAYHKAVIPRFSDMGAAVNGVKAMSGTIRISGAITNV